MYDVWDQKFSNRKIEIDGNGTRNVRVAIYCRVSTEHEEQVKALDNQIDWFNSIIQIHPNWELVESKFSAQSKRRKERAPLREVEGYYIDEGLSGLTTNRPALNKLIEDCKNKKIDLILTREVCRFSRNIPDAINICRELKSREIGVGVFFYQDNIFTYDSDSEMKLGLFATFAQCESEKVSERVRAGQKTSKDKGVLYGNGNILGYNLVKKNGSNAYEINNEQAETVRRIFQLSLDGYGVIKIGDTLTKERRLNASGRVKWNYQTILRILEQKLYCGYFSYNVTICDSCFDKNRHSVNKDERLYKKAPPEIIPPIISEEIFNACQEQRKKRKKEYFNSKTGSGKATSAKDVFAKKLRCKCGSSFRRDTWHKNKSGVITHGYKCYNVLNHAKATNYTDEDEIKELNICDMTAISESKLRMQALKVFNGLINGEELLEDTIKASKNQSKKITRNIESEISVNEDKLKKLQARKIRYIDMRADNEITEDEFNVAKNNTDNEMALLQSKIKELETQNIEESKPKVDERIIKEALSKILDCTENIDDRLIDKFVYKIIVDTPNKFIWQLHFKPITSTEPKFIHLCTHNIDIEYAINYSKKHHITLKKPRWKDMEVVVQIAI